VSSFGPLLPSNRSAPSGADLLTTKFFRTMTNEHLYIVRSRIDEVLTGRFPQHNQLAAKLLPDTPSTTPAPAANGELAQVLSPSQLDKWRDCQASWYFRYVRRLEDITDGNRALGKAIHKAAEVYARVWIEDKQRLDLGAITTIFRAAMQAELEERIVLQDGDTPESIEMQGVSLLATLHPALNDLNIQQIEVPVEGNIAGVPVRGRIDMLDDQGRVIDLKTAAKSPSGVPHRQRVQLATYKKLVPGCFGECQVITVVKNKTPKVMTMTVTASEADGQMIESLYPLAQEAMRAGLYYPNRESFLCSRRRCSYWAACQAEFGGTVAE
jgi:putative RecB family exonuclease